MPAEQVSSSVWTVATHGVVSSGAVTVTSVNVQDIAMVKSEPVIDVEENISVKHYQDDSSDSDNEIRRIEFSAVRMRNKRVAPYEKEPERAERPMSWEGELSDTETTQEEPENTVESNGKCCIMVNSTENISDNPEAVGDPLGVEEPLNFSNTNPSEHVSENDFIKTSRTGSHPEIPLLVDKLLGSCYSSTLQRKSSKVHIRPSTSPDSAVNSCYSPIASPVISRHLPSSGFSSPSPFTPSLSRNNSDASHSSSCYSQSYSSMSASPTQFSPSHSPVQRRRSYKNLADYTAQCGNSNVFNMSKNAPAATSEETCVDTHQEHCDEIYEERIIPCSNSEIAHASNLSTSSGISRQQLINSPCPICGDKISGFHYGIFSCESCKGFFKRTVQNHKNYVCLRGSSCLVTVATRKKCPACRFDKCLSMGMKLEAIRVDRTRGGRSTYPFSYTLPAALAQTQNMMDGPGPGPVSSQSPYYCNGASKYDPSSGESSSHSPPSPRIKHIPQLLQEIMDVEHLWQCNENDKPSGKNENGANPNFVSNLCNIADHRLYKIVKWCKSLPLFKNISTDDQISLLINAWCELLLFSCCYRSMCTPGEIRVSLGKSISLSQAKDLGLSPCIERMLNFTEHLRRLRVDRYEYVAMKVIVLLSSDSSDLREAEKARASQEKVLQALQQYTVTHYPDMPSKFGELLLRIPDLQRACQVGKDMLSLKHKGGEEDSSFDLLMELLRGDH